MRIWASTASFPWSCFGLDLLRDAACPGARIGLIPISCSLHFWLTAIGFGIYFVFLTIGGVLQGIDMLDPGRPFMGLRPRSLTPYLLARDVSAARADGRLGHVVFRVPFSFAMALNLGPRRSGSVVLWNARSGEARS